MAINDAYGTSTADGQQIRIDVIRPIGLWALAIPANTGSTPNTTILNSDDLFEFRPTVDCIIDFTTTAVTNPNGHLAVHVRANETILIAPPVRVISLSMVALQTAGTLYLAKYVNWAGLANTTTLETQ